MTRCYIRMGCYYCVLVAELAMGVMYEWVVIMKGALFFSAYGRPYIKLVCPAFSLVETGGSAHVIYCALLCA